MVMKHGVPQVSFKMGDPTKEWGVWTYAKYDVPRMQEMGERGRTAPLISCPDCGKTGFVQWPIRINGVAEGPSQCGCGWAAYVKLLDWDCFFKLV